MVKLLIYYEACHQATFFRLYIDGHPSLKLMKIPDCHSKNDAIMLRIDWLSKRPAIKRGTGAIQIEVTPEVTQILDELQFLLGN